MADTPPSIVSYDPNAVVSLATAKCQAGGMITTQQNLQNALSEGRITQEEYNEYYPYHYDKDLRKLTLATDTPNKRLDGIVAEPNLIYEKTGPSR